MNRRGQLRDLDLIVGFMMANGGTTCKITPLNVVTSYSASKKERKPMGWVTRTARSGWAN
ncbi:hypothetical protein FOTG_17910 [Fusarium oxysporum f. sp. vasinfectum 25433]|uniref:Uncharacterized protein n=1 Tax=Fusarium oxysporum f. sp. vasinfectum 25433 TaxID=1089449 RepID=X0KY81_FUSOX|nr:hypothetical protein FOTG_17910 [Fusarium oxysporum f. sp. vasinfectum 25433]